MKNKSLTWCEYTGWSQASRRHVQKRHPLSTQTRHYLIFCTKWRPTALSLVIMSLKYTAIFVLWNWTILKQLRGCFWFAFLETNNHRTCWSFKSNPGAKSETKLTSQLEFLAWRTGKGNLCFLHHPSPNAEACLIRKGHQRERSGTLWTVTGIDKSVEKTYKQERGFFPLLHICTGEMSFLVQGQKWEWKEEENPIH